MINRCGIVCSGGWRLVEEGWEGGGGWGGWGLEVDTGNMRLGGCGLVVNMVGGGVKYILGSNGLVSVEGGRCHIVTPTQRWDKWVIISSQLGRGITTPPHPPLHIFISAECKSLATGCDFWAGNMVV